jgi:hypothetical protein
MRQCPCPPGRRARHRTPSLFAGLVGLLGDTLATASPITASASASHTRARRARHLSVRELAIHGGVFMATLIGSNPSWPPTIFLPSRSRLSPWRARETGRRAALTNARQHEKTRASPPPHNDEEGRFLSQKITPADAQRSHHRSPESLAAGRWRRLSPMPI